MDDPNAPKVKGVGEDAAAVEGGAVDAGDAANGGTGDAANGGTGETGVADGDADGDADGGADGGPSEQDKTFTLSVIQQSLEMDGLNQKKSPKQIKEIIKALFPSISPDDLDKMAAEVQKGGRRRTKRKGRKGSRKSKKGAKKSKKGAKKSQKGGRRSSKNRRKQSSRRKH